MDIIAKARMTVTHSLRGRGSIAAPVGAICADFLVGDVGIQCIMRETKLPKTARTLINSIGTGSVSGSVIRVSLDVPSALSLQRSSHMG